MSYEAEVSRSNPSAFLFLVDMSGSMTDPYGSGKRKADGVADAINKLLSNLSIKCTKSEGVRDYYEVGVISYGKKVEPALGGELAGQALAPISAVANHPARVEERTKKEDDGTGGIAEVKVKFPIWFDPKAAGSTPMCKAFQLAHESLQAWVTAHPYSFPPIVINITDGESTDGDPATFAEAIRTLQTQDGNVLLFNCHISGAQGSSVLFADAEEGLPDQYAKLLYNMSSVLPDAIREGAQREGFAVSDNSRGFAFNADLVELIRFLDIGTRPSNLR
ncbi:MAG TPA: vWA domain-containing protein [Candidatus Eisenbacteria bacterium]